VINIKINDVQKKESHQPCSVEFSAAFKALVCVGIQCTKYMNMCEGFQKLLGFSINVSMKHTNAVAYNV